MTHGQAFELACSLADAGFSCEQTFTKRGPYTTVVLVEKRIDSAGLKRLLNLAPPCAELVLIDGVLQFLPTQGGSR